MDETRTDLLIRAMRKQLEKYRHDLDADRDLRSVMVIVKLSNGGMVRSAILSRESGSDENGTGGSS
jgi:hypothetical protein